VALRSALYIKSVPMLPEPINATLIYSREFRCQLADVLNPDADTITRLQKSAARRATASGSSRSQ